MNNQGKRQFTPVYHLILLGFASGVCSALSFDFIGRLFGIEIILLILSVLGVSIFIRQLKNNRWVLGLAVSLAVTFISYIISDLYNSTAPEQFLRGWARFIFLVTNFLGAIWITKRPAGVASLFVGLAVGDAFLAFGSGGGLVNWKFGWAQPVTLAIVLYTCIKEARGGVLLFCVGILNFWWDYRSLGLICILTAASLLFKSIKRFNLRNTIIVVIGVAVLCLVVWAIYTITYRDHQKNERAEQSNMLRFTMALTTIEIASKSPLLGYGSWARSNEFAARSIERQALLTGIDSNKILSKAYTDDLDLIVSHSHILQSIIEGGLLSASFFVFSTIIIVLSILKILKRECVSYLNPLLLFAFYSVLWALFFSPFAGPHRYTLAIGLALSIHVLKVPATNAKLFHRRNTL